jgi:cytochrome c
MAKPGRLAAYIQKAMAVYAGSLTDEQARDIAAFIDAQPRPGRGAP